VKCFVQAAVIAAFLAAAPASAQLTPPDRVQYGIAAGLPIPLGELADITRTSLSVLATLAFNPDYMPIGLRFDLANSAFEPKGGGRNVNYTSGTVNLVFISPSATASPYLIGGLGVYSSNVDINATAGADTNLGLNFGAGLKIPLGRFQTFLEARYNRVSASIGTVDFVPITFGILF
jgi:hypothetical protein